MEGMKTGLNGPPLCQQHVPVFPLQIRFPGGCETSPPLLWKAHIQPLLLVSQFHKHSPLIT